MIYVISVKVNKDEIILAAGTHEHIRQKVLNIAKLKYWRIVISTFNQGSFSDMNVSYSIYDALKWIDNHHDFWEGSDGYVPLDEIEYIDV